MKIKIIKSGLDWFVYAENKYILTLRKRKQKQKRYYIYTLCTSLCYTFFGLREFVSLKEAKEKITKILEGLK